tara:strand:- start:312 stop:596 length:285 start_codon:yes stop_codon:yes gene_type:complete
MQVLRASAFQGLHDAQPSALISKITAEMMVGGRFARAIVRRSALVVAVFLIHWVARRALGFAIRGRVNQLCAKVINGLLMRPVVKDSVARGGNA